MALGFGPFRSTDKVLPGTYVNLLGGAAGLRPPLVDPNDPGTGPEDVNGTAIATCTLCGKFDGEHFPMSKFEVGVNAPPFHPNCRGCVSP